jgi:hypothetical protein
VPICARCSQPFTQRPGRHRPRLYCTDVCTQKAKHAKEGRRRAATQAASYGWSIEEIAEALRQRAV